MKNISRIFTLFALLSLGLFGQVSNVQVASGLNPDITKPATGFNFPSGFTLNVKSGATISGAGTYDFSSGTAFKVPNGAAPTTSAFGALAGDNNAWASGRGALQFYDGTANTYVVAALASDTPTDGQVATWHTGGTITWDTAGAGTIGGSTGATDNALIRADGTGGSTIQNSTASLSDDAVLTLPQVSLAANTSGDGAILSNSTAATAANQRYSPRLRLTGNGWKTNATAGSRVVDYIAEVRPVQGAANPTAQLVFASQINGGGFTDRLTLDSGGGFYVGVGGTGPLITSSGGQLILTPTASTVLINRSDTGNSTLVINSATAATTGTQINYQINGTTKVFTGLASATNAFVTGAATNDYVIRLDGGNVVFTMDSGTSISQRFVASTGAFLNYRPTAGFGYGTGAGGAVTQITSRTTGVTLNTVSGAITLVSAAGSATPASFTVTNSAVAATDVIIVNQKSGTDLYQIFVTNVAAGSFKITSFTTGGTTTEQPVFNFAVIKAVAN